MYVRGTLATILSSLGNWCLDLALKLELRDWPGSYVILDTSKAPFHAPDEEVTFETKPPGLSISFTATSGERVHINAADYALPPDIEHGGAPQ